MRRALIVLGLAACGDSRHVPDAAPPVDAETQMGLVSVQYLTDEDAGGGGYQVFFQNADSSLVLATHTQADGQANAFMMAGGFVTLASPTVVWTFSDVQPGDHLLIDRRNNNDQTTYRVRVPPAGDVDTIDLVTTCGTANVTFAQTNAIPVKLGNCTPGFDMLALTRIGVGNDPVSYLYADSVALVPTQSYTMPGSYQPLGASTIVVTNSPYSGVQVTQSVMGTHGVLYQQNPAGLAADGGITLETRLPLAAGMRLFTDVTSTDFTDVLKQHVVTWRPVGETAPTTEIDLAERVHRTTSQPRFDATSSTITWTEDDGGTPPNAVTAGFNFGFQGMGAWRIAAPHGAEPVIHVPVLPGIAYQLDDSVNVFDLVTIAADGGYASLRERLAGWRPAIEQLPITGDSGHLLYCRPSGLGPID